MNHINCLVDQVVKFDEYDGILRCFLTPEQVQELKKIGFRNRNYVSDGVCGAFGGVVQNMHMHGKFHETVQISLSGRGVKEKSLNRNSMNTYSGIGVYTESDDTMNEDTLVGVASAVQEGVTPFVVDMMLEKEKICSLEEITVLESFTTLTTPVTSTDCNAPGKSSYANITGKPSRKEVNVHTLFTPGGKKVAYTVIAKYVRNTWGKYGLVRSMFSSSTGLFSFQFSSMDGLDAMLENGPWFIRNNLLILKKWHPDENLLKEDVSIVPVWVKLHGVPVMAFSEDGLSAIATKLSTPLMLNSYTSDMCIQSWGRSSYARVILADVELKDNIIVAMPKITREGPLYIKTGASEKRHREEAKSNFSCVSVGPKWVLNLITKDRPVPKKTTASSSGNKKKGVEPTIEGDHGYGEGIGWACIDNMVMGPVICGFRKGTGGCWHCGKGGGCSWNKRRAFTYGGEGDVGVDGYGDDKTDLG
ncbi:zinc finger, CCHC-type containing protein [Tanacetum coccineum]